MEIYLVRHTTPDVLPGTCYGHSDIDVTETFLAEFEALHPKLRHLKNPVIYSSPLQRCMKLAESMAATFSPQLTVQPDPRLKELNFGDWEMRSWNDIPRGLVDVWAEDHVRHVPPNGESFQQLFQRAQSFFADLQHEQQPALVFTHAGVIRALMGYALGLPLVHTFKLQIDYASVSKIIVAPQFTSVAYVNR
ncbi:alpha-ribazole phosphatase [Methylobacillus flagellatus]|uniref:Alpha-ribazole phosphatase n=1 Tax=Methylobacillus flagellatus (strain ATCC 51484 / DSM 6875 / VKM B-1610 / KT) TaxID=265072 RepID=Q1GXF8_METFK|nr:alpha-ribazole phosphatase [Methylobacillus flagellatus]ABE48371.1 Phosphoglycerate mutase [Methylobacillus flagellatus KT]